MPNLSSLDRTQQVLDIIFKQFDVLLADYSRHEATTILARRHQVDRHKLVALLNDRAAGLIGTSGTSSVSVQSTVQA